MKVLALLIFSHVPQLAMAQENWTIKTTSDPMTDVSQTWYFTNSLSDFECDIGTSSAQLLVGCTAEGARVIVGTTACFFAGNSVGYYRVDSNSRDVYSNQAQSSGTAFNLSGLVDPYADNFVRHILAGSSLLVEFNPGQIASFDIQGLRGIIGRDFDNCSEY